MTAIQRSFAVAVFAVLPCVLSAARSAALDVEFAKELLAIPSESRSIPECNRATAFLRGYLEKRGVYCHVRRTEEGRDALTVMPNLYTVYELEDFPAEDVIASPDLVAPAEKRLADHVKPVK